MSGLVWKFPASPVVKTGPFHCHSLTSVSAGEVRSCKPERCGQKKKKFAHPLDGCYPPPKKKGTSENKFSGKYRELEPLCAVGKNTKWCSHYGKQYKCLWKIKNITTIWSSNPASKRISKKTGSRILKNYLHTHVHCSTIDNRKKWKQPKCSWMDDWINQVCCIHTTEYYLAFK